MPSRHELAAAAFHNPQAVTSAGGAQASSIKPSSKPKTPSYLDSKGPATPSPAGQRASQTTHRLGERQQKNGHTYELQERGQRHEWVRVDEEKGGPGTPPTGGKPQESPHPAKAHEFAKSQLSQVDEPLRGVFAAMHAHPDAKSSGSVLSQDVAPQLARQVYDHLRQNAAKPVGGAAAVGQSIDLGEGRLGYASPAGSIIVFPPDASGKQKISYTNQTGVVKRAMGGGQAGPSQGSPAPPPSPQQGQPASSAAAPTGSDPNATGPQSQQRMPAGNGANPVPPPGANPQPQQAGAPPVKGQMAQATPDQAKAMSVLMEKPQPPARETPKNPRHAAELARGELETAVNGWQEALAGGLSPQGNRHWQQYVAARKAVWSNLNQVANAHDKANAPPKGKAAKDENDGLSEHEISAKTADPKAYAELQKMGGKALGGLYEAAIEAMAKGVHHISYDPEKGGKSVEQEAADQAARNPRSDLGKSAAKRAAEGKPAQVSAGDSTGLKSMGSGMGSAMTDNMYDALWSKVEAGDTNEGGKPSALLQVAKAARAAGGMSSPEHLRALAKDYADAKGQGLKGEEFQKAMNSLVAKHGGTSPDEDNGIPAAELAAMKKMGIQPKVDKEAGRRGHQQNIIDAEREAGTRARSGFKTTPEIAKDLEPKERQAAALRREAAKGFGVEAPDLLHDLKKSMPGNARAKEASQARSKEAELREEARKGIAPEVPRPEQPKGEEKPAPKAKTPKGPKQRKPIEPDKLKGIVSNRLKKHGVEHDDNLHGNITSAINEGHIASGKHLDSVMKETKRLIGKGKSPDVASRMAVEKLRGKREASAASPHTKKSAAEKNAVLNAHAESWGIDPEDHRAMLEEMLPHYIETKYKPDREEAKKALREATGVTPAKIAQFENKGGGDSDSLSKHDKLISAIAAEYPQYFGDDYMNDAFELLREDPKRMPEITDPEFLEHADEFFSKNSQSDSIPKASGTDDMQPFARIRKGFVLRYRNWLKAADAFVMP